MFTQFNNLYKLIMFEQTENMQLVKYTTAEIKSLFDEGKIYSDNKYINFENLTKLFYNNILNQLICKFNNEIVAITTYKIKDNILYCCELFGLKKSYSEKILQCLLNLDYVGWSRQDSLNQYYCRSAFNLTEYIIKKWLGNLLFFQK